MRNSSGSDNGRKGGRPTRYSEAVADEICRRLMEGETLNRICADARMPCRVTIWRWLDDVPGFCNRYMRARVVQATTLADEAMDMLRACPDKQAVRRLIALGLLVLVHRRGLGRGPSVYRVRPLPAERLGGQAAVPLMVTGRCQTRGHSCVPHPIRDHNRVAALEADDA